LESQLEGKQTIWWICYQTIMVENILIPSRASILLNKQHNKSIKKKKMLEDNNISQNSYKDKDSTKILVLLMLRLPNFQDHWPNLNHTM